ncbi:MAG: hypothetical protein QNK33_07520, partial [Bacteroidales bacterium]|nr:hypothetical protein [Bacteroidales bacterium]
MRKLILFIVILMLVVVQACVKTTVDMDKVSNRIGISPAYVLAVVKGNVDLGNIIEPNDTLFFDDLGLMTVVFKEDSIINFALEDFYESFEESSFTSYFPILPTVEEVMEEPIDIDPGDGIILSEMKVVSGSIEYTIISDCDYDVAFQLILTSVMGEPGNPITETIYVGPNETVSGEVSIDGALIDFTYFGALPGNNLHFSGLIIPDGTISDDPGSVEISVNVPEPEFDYIKGYFGMQTEESEADTIDLDMEDIFSKITGSFSLSSPKITVNYSNSFGIPLRVEALATGKNSSEEIDLVRAPVDLLYPLTTDVRDAEGFFTIDKTNSELPSLVSMLPNEIIFSGSANSNPDGDTETNNIIFGDSRFIAGIEIEVPMEFRINNLTLTDTIDNFFLSDDGDESPLDMISDLELMMYIENGFPLGGAFSLTPYDSISDIKSTAVLGSDDFFDPAEVDGNGRVTSSTEKRTVISMTDQFISDAGEYDKMILSFTLFTPNSPTQDVKIYSDYN